MRLPPAYRPGLNPIEKAFAKRKARHRAATKRTVRAVEGYLGE
ncbi:hypothetical protein [Limnoglobus roseus]|nr:hypothetical protein [Limnoglobus roseus]